MDSSAESSSDELNDKFRLVAAESQYVSQELIDECTSYPPDGTGTSCKTVFNEREVEIAEGTRPLVPLRLICPTKNCPSVPGRLGLSG